MNGVLADVFALYLKTKNFHWHMSGPHFRDYHLLLDEQADQIFAMTDPIAERVRKVGGSTLRSIGQIARCSASSTTTPTTSSRRTCWPSCARTTRSWRPPARRPRRLRRAPRHRDDQPDRGLDRRDRTADLVPVRGEPAAGRYGAVGVASYRAQRQRPRASIVVIGTPCWSVRVRSATSRASRYRPAGPLRWRGGGRSRRSPSCAKRMSTRIARRGQPLLAAYIVEATCFIAFGARSTAVESGLTAIERTSWCANVSVR